MLQLVPNTRRLLGAGRRCLSGGLRRVRSRVRRTRRGWSAKSAEQTTDRNSSLWILSWAILISCWGQCWMQRVFFVAIAITLKHGYACHSLDTRQKSNFVFQNGACLVGELFPRPVRVFCTHLEPPNGHFFKTFCSRVFRMFWILRISCKTNF